MRFHLTRRDRLPSILAHGLVPGSEILFTEATAATDWTLECLFGGRMPVFLSDGPWFERRDYRFLAEHGEPDDFVLLEVEDDGLGRLPDVVSLGDRYTLRFGAERVLWLDDEHPLSAWEGKDRSITYAAFAADGELCEKVCALTGTVAITEAIAPRRLRVCR